MKKHTKKWFRNRIGKTIYRNKLRCSCKTCQKTAIVIKDMTEHNLRKEFHADYIYDCQNVYEIEYSDTEIVNQENENTFKEMV